MFSRCNVPLSLFRSGNTPLVLFSTVNGSVGSSSTSARYISILVQCTVVARNVGDAIFLLTLVAGVVNCIVASGVILSPVVLSGIRL